MHNRGKKMSAESVKRHLFYLVTPFVVIFLSIVLTYHLLFVDVPVEISSSSAKEILILLLRIDATLLSFTVAFIGLAIKQIIKQKHLVVMVTASIISYCLSLINGFKLMIIASNQDHVRTVALLFPILTMISVLFVLISFIAYMIPKEGSNLPRARNSTNTYSPSITILFHKIISDSI